MILSLDLEDQKFVADVVISILEKLKAYHVQRNYTGAQTDAIFTQVQRDLYEAHLEINRVSPPR